MKKDFELIYDNLTYGLAKYCKENGIKSMVLGISGGIDSTITAAIANPVCLELNIPLIGVSLPSGTNEFEETSAANKVGKTFCTRFNEANINNLYNNAEMFLNEIAGSINNTKIAKGNIKARLRMMTLYHLASITGGIVLDTDNKTEHFTGFFTVHGDEGDIGVLRDLDKTTIFEFAKWLAYDSDILTKEQRVAVQLSMSLNPTDGNGVGCDLDQFGLSTYSEVDAVVNGEETENVGNVLKLHKKTWYKRLPRPFYIGIDGTYRDSNENEFKID